jgi:hypothetical protein
LSCVAFMYSDFGILTISASVSVFALLAAIDPVILAAGLGGGGRLPGTPVKSPLV